MICVSFGREMGIGAFLRDGERVKGDYLPSITPLMTASQWKSGALWPMRTFPSMDILICFSLNSTLTSSFHVRINT